MKLRCKCGFLQIVDNIDDNICPICGKNMMLDKVEFKESKMKDMLKEMGDKNLWNTIEQIKDPMVRIEKRKEFFNVGGKL